MASKWSRYRAVKKDFEELLKEIGVPVPTARKKLRTSATYLNDVCEPPDLREDPGCSKLKRNSAVASEAAESAKLAVATEAAESANSELADTSCECMSAANAENCLGADEDEHRLLTASSSGNSSSSEDDNVPVIPSAISLLSAGPAREEGTVPGEPHRRLSEAEELALIASKHNWTHASINDVLDLWRRRGMSHLPKDARTLMKTQRKAHLKHNDSFVHFGLEEGIRQALSVGTVPCEVKLQGNIDGVPLYKSSQVGFWPILCRIANVKRSAPFMVSIYCGTGKPPNLGDYLNPFLQEVHQLTSNGMVIKGVHVRVSLTALICDAPARAYVKAITGHTGYHACERCCQKGRYMESRVTFPDLQAPKRTDASFRSQEDHRHHSGVSPFVLLQIDMVAFFPTEYMHLVCLGVMRRLLRNWVCPGQRGRLSRLQRRHLNESLRESARNFPEHFQRKPRGTEELDRWKATEFRTFLLYLGPVVLKPVLAKEHYKHFLVFHVAIRLLVSQEHYLSYNEYAGDLLKYFVQEFGNLYGEHQLVYNVHTLVHLAEQCQDHGPLDEFSAFPFESFLGKVKKKLRTSTKPISQISRRMSEVQYDTGSVQPKRVVKLGDCFLVEDSLIVVVEVSAHSCKGCVLLNQRSFFKVPLQSSCLNIWRCDGLGNETKVYPLSALRVQCLKLHYKQSCVVLPIVHLK